MSIIVLTPTGYDDFMVLIDAIRRKIGASDFEYSQHAVDQTTLRHISVHELREAISNGQVIEDYPSNKYGLVV